MKLNCKILMMRVVLPGMVALLLCMNEAKAQPLWQWEYAPPGKYFFAMSDSITGIWDTINHQRLGLKFGWVGGGGGSGTVTSITAASPLTGGTITTSGTIGIQNATTSQNGALTSTDWNTFNNKLSSASPNDKYNQWTKTGNVITGLWRKYIATAGTGAIARIPYYSNDTTLTSEAQYMINNSTNAYTIGIGFTGGNSTFGNYIDNNGALPGGLVIRDSDRPGIGFSTSATDRWSISSNSNTNSDLMFKFSSTDSWGSTPLMKINEGGAVYINDLANSTAQMVVAGAGGLLSTQAIPASGATNLNFTGTASPYDLTSSTGTGVKFASGANMTITRSGNTLTFAASGGGGAVPSPWLDAANISIGAAVPFDTELNTWKYIDNNSYTPINANTSTAIEPFSSNRKIKIISAGYYRIIASISVESTTQAYYGFCIQSGVNDAGYGCNAAATSFVDVPGTKDGNLTVQTIIEVTSANVTAGGLFLRLALFCDSAQTMNIYRTSLTVAKIN